MNKRNYLFLSISFFLILSLNSCVIDSNDACFSTDFDNYDVGELVQFKNCSTAATDYLWDFGDGTQEYGQEVSHAYAYAGDYNVTLTAYFGSDTKVARAVVHVFEPTELLITTYYEGSSVTVEGVDVILYNSIQDWQQDSYRVATGITDSNGEVRFVSDRAAGFNLNEQEYFVYASRDADNGSGYYSNEQTNYSTGILNRSSVNYFDIDLRFYPYKKKKR